MITQTQQLANTLLPKRDSIFAQLAKGDIVQYYQDSQSANTATQFAVSKPSFVKRFIALPAYYWVLISQFFVFLPIVTYMPTWLGIYVVISIIMQFPKVKQQFQKTSKSSTTASSLKTIDKYKRLKNTYQIVQLSVFFFSLFGLWITYKGFNVEAGIAFLLLCAGSKLWEMYQKRDALITLNLSLFVLASLFLLDKGALTGLQVIVAVLAVFMAFIAINDDVDDIQADSNMQHKQHKYNVSAEHIMQVDGSGRVRSLLLLTSLSLPLLVILFLFFPRLPPLWTFNMATDAAKTGVSDSMSPGDFSQLSKSSELAFRVEFQQDMPKMADMYWRGLVFSDFDGITWQQNKQQLRYWQNNKKIPPWLDITDAGQQAQITDNTNAQLAIDVRKDLNYSVIMEPSNNNWLYALDYPYKNQTEIGLSSNYTLVKSTPVNEQFSYQTAYQNNLFIDKNLTPQQQKVNLALPDTGNDKARQLARQLYQQAGSTEAYIKQIYQWTVDNRFVYTLSPPKLGSDRIDEFLFDTRAGFCEHYASSFVFLMRAAGIPARVVVGYQGGKLGRDGSSWEVRQMDAHAWTEVWIAKKGWVRVDPTAFVAPDRIQQGMSELTDISGAEMFGNGVTGQLSYQQFKMLAEFRRFSDQLSYYWQKNIVGYDQEAQASKLLKWFNLQNLYKQVFVMVLLAVATFPLVTFILWYRQRRIWHPVDRQLVILSKAIAKQHPELMRKDNEGYLLWLQRVEVTAAFADNQSELQTLQKSYRTLRYGRLSTANSESSDEYALVLQNLKQVVNDLKRTSK